MTPRIARVSRRTLAALACIAWAALTAWAFIHAATRRDDDVPARWREDDDGVQAWDERSVTLASGYGEWVN
jgi:hypothetical protein